MRQGKGWRAAARTLGFAAAALVAAALANGGAAEEPPLKGRFADAFAMAKEPYPAPSASFQARDGERVSLRDFRGRVLLVNFWATWCAPCVEEMPTLDALEGDLKDQGLTVIAVSQDRGGQSAVEPFLRNRLDLHNLGIYLDPDAQLARAFGTGGILPTTYLIDARGRVIGGMRGAADWNSPEAKALVRHYLDKAKQAGTIETGG